MKKWLYVCVAGLSAAAVSCTLSSNGGEKVEPERDMVTFTVALPEESVIPTKAEAPDNQTIISIDALIFDGTTRRFIERVKVPAGNVSGTGAFKSFSFPYDPVLNPVIIHFVINGRAGSAASATDLVNFGILTAGALEENAIPQLTYAMNNATYPSFTGFPVPMWGRVGLASLQSPTVIGNPVPVLRALSAVTVEKDVPTAENGLNDLSLESFTILNAPMTAYVAPANYTSPAVQPLQTSAPSFIATGNYGTYSGTIGVGGSFAGSWIEAGKTFFVAEQKYNPGANYTNAVTALVYARYSGPLMGSAGDVVQCLYAIPLMNGSSMTSEPTPIVRNTVYRMKVLSVNAVGFSTQAHAVAAPATLYAEITNSDNEVYDIVSDGIYWLGVSKKTYISAGQTWSTPTAIGNKVYTNLPQSEITVSLKAETGAGISGVSYNQTNGIMIGTLTAGTVGAKATVTVKARNLARDVIIERE